MKKLMLVLLFVMTANLSCSAPLAAATAIPTQVTPTLKPPSVTTPIPTNTAIVVEPDLMHLPLVWFGPLPPLPVVEGRPFTGSDDFMQLFETEAPWQTAAGNIQVFKLYGEWVGNHPGDAQLQGVVRDLNRRGLAIAVETGPLDPGDCGEGIEGFSTIQAALKNANDIKSAGGTLHIIAMDEPYYYAHFYDGPNACHWPAEKVAVEVDEFIQAVRKIFPDVIIGDTEPLAGAAGAKEYQEWLDVFLKVNGYPLEFIHMDVDWSRPNWPEEVKAIQDYGREIGVPVGIIYNGNAFDPTDEDYLIAAGERVKKLELAGGVQPDHVIFQSWNDKPDRVLPESEPYSFTGFINQYFTNKDSLGYLREGKNANIALGKPVQFSGQTGDLTGALAVDGDFGTLWNSGGGPTQWLEIDLGAEYDIQEIRLSISQFPEGQTVHLIKGKGIGTGDQFVLLHTFDGITRDGDELVFNPENPISGIHSIYIETVASPSWVAWREIEVISE